MKKHDAVAIGVDFDGVLHAYSRGWQDGSIYDDPVPGALEGLRELMDASAVFIFTSREPGQVMPWLERHGFNVTTDDRCARCLGVRVFGSGQCPSCKGSGKLTFWDLRGQLLVTSRKLPAVAYLDDRAVRFTSWDAALVTLLGGE